MQQDSTSPTGIRDDSPRGNSEVARAQNRKANAALQMKLAGATWGEIAETLGFPTERTAIVATERALERELQTEESKRYMRAIASKRLERLLRSVWTKSINENGPDHLAAVDRARQLLDRHIRLHGLDAPTEMVVHSPNDAQLERWVTTVLAQSTEVVEEYDIFDAEVVDTSSQDVNGEDSHALPSGS